MREDQMPLGQHAEPVPRNTMFATDDQLARELELAENGARHIEAAAGAMIRAIATVRSHLTAAATPEPTR